MHMDVHFKYLQVIVMLSRIHAETCFAFHGLGVITLQ